MTILDTAWRHLEATTNTVKQGVKQQKKMGLNPTGQARMFVVGDYMEIANPHFVNNWAQLPHQA